MIIPADRRYVCVPRNPVSVPPTTAEQLRRADDAQWFAAEAQPHEPALRAWLRAQYPHLNDVDDVVQESYFRLLRARTAGRIESAKSYLFGIARNVAVGVFRRERIFVEPVDKPLDPDDLPAEGSLLEIVDLNQRLALAEDAIRTLPSRCREVVILRALHGLSYAEIAERLGLAEETVRVQMARGVKRCAEWLRKRDGREGFGA